MYNSLEIYGPMYPTLSILGQRFTPACMVQSVVQAVQYVVCAVNGDKLHYLPSCDPAPPPELTAAVRLQQ